MNIYSAKLTNSKYNVRMMQGADAWVVYVHEGTPGNGEKLVDFKEFGTFSESMNYVNENYIWME